jgi:uncharacterized RDD family membrane protein YckC
VKTRAAPDQKSRKITKIRSTTVFLVTIPVMKRKDFLESPMARARFNRFMAKLIDVGLVTLGAVFYYPMGLILGVIYLCISDSLYDGQSIGKRFMGFGVVSLIDGTPCSTWQSFIRNLPFTVPLFFFIFPYWGWIFSAVFALPLAFMEIYFLFKQKSMHRLGDMMADTTVIANDGTRLDLRKQKSPWLDRSPLPM